MNAPHERSDRFEIPPDHDHHMLIYESESEQFASLAPFLGDGLSAGDRCLYFLHHNTADEVAVALRERGVDADAALDSGQLSFRDATDVYLPGDDFDPEGTVDRLERLLSETLEAGYDRLRIAGEMTWAVEHDVDFDLLEAYERQADEIYLRDSAIGLCQYRRSEFPSEPLDNVFRTHPRILYDAGRETNSFYQTPEEHAGDGSDATAIDRELQTISERRSLSESLDERERWLSLLGRYSGQLREAEPAEVMRIAGSVAAETVEPSLVCFCRYDSAAGELRTEYVRNAVSGVSTERATETLGEQAWDAFVESEEREFAIEADRPLTGVVLPVGRRGVLVVGTFGADIGGTDLDFLRSVCGHAEAVLDRIVSERDLEERNAELNEQNAHLERVNQINAVVREINRSLVGAAGVEEIEEAVCDLLVRETPASFAWFGNYEAATDTLRPKRAAGAEQSYLDALTADGGGITREPAGRAARSREPEAVRNVHDGQPLAYWQKQALKRGFQSVVSLPVCFDESMYGVLSLYSDAPDAFAGEMQTVLDELSDSVAHAINSIKRKQALVTEAVTELEIRLTDADVPLGDLVRRTGCRIDVDEVVAASDGGFRLFGDIEGATPAEIRSFETASPVIDEVEIFSEGDRSHPCEWLVTDRCFVVDLLAHSAVPQSVQIEDGEIDLLLRLPRETDVREFMEMMTSKYPDAEVVGRRSRQRPLRRLPNVRGRLEEDLTDRQLEILKLAYYSGYFQQPQGTTVEDLADSLGVSHPTVSRHLRKAERRTFSLLFGTDRQ